MNPERDSDRQLRAWVATGVDRAPERFVWAALDEIEQLPQRTRWRTRLDGFGIRLRPVAALVGSAAVLLVAVAILARIVAPVGVGDSRTFESVDLQGMVLWEDTMPPTWTLDNLVTNADQVRLTPIRSMTDAELLALPSPEGLLAGRYTDFSGPDAVFISWGLAFASDNQAAAALPRYEDEMASPDGWGLSSVMPITMGDGGFLYAGMTTALMGEPESTEPIRSQIYLWRDANVLLAVGGWFDFDENELRGVVEAMDRRAGAIAGGASRATP